VNRYFVLFNIFLSLSFGCFAESACGDKIAGDQAPRFAFAPEFHFWQDLHEFFNQKDSTFKNRYLLGWNSGAELAFLSYSNRFFFFLEMTATVGLGKWADKPILFDPREVDIGLGPMFEYRFTPVNVALGLDHHCFHQIDSDPARSDTPDDQKVMYWNKFYLNASSPNFRKNGYRMLLKSDVPLTLKNRLAWSAGLYYSLHEFFGMDTSIVSWNQPYALDLTGEVRYAVYRFKGIACVLNAKTGAYFTRKNTTAWSPLWNQQLGAELLATTGVFGLGLFINWIVVDQLPPRQNMDRLIAVGLNGFN
jgi:hypothetical protein